MNTWRHERVIKDDETGLYGIGGKNHICYDSMFTKEVAKSILRIHRAGFDTFEDVLAEAKSRGINIEVAA